MKYELAWPASLFSIKKCAIAMRLLFVLFISADAVTAQQPASEQEGWIRSIAPSDGVLLVDKKPELKAEFVESISPSTLVVLVDGVDITQLLTITEKGFTYKPVMVIPPGSHTMSISVTNQKGSQFYKTVSFATRHSSAFEEITLSADTTGIYSSTLEKDADDATTPYSSVEALSQVRAKIKEGPDDLSAEGMPIYIDQNKPLLSGVSPLTQAVKKGFDIRNFILKGEHKGSMLRLKGEAGDVMVNMTQYTAQGLARRGGQLTFGYKDAELSLFSVRSPAIYGLRGGFGIKFKNDQLYGGMFKLSLPSLNTEIKTAYLTGKDDSSLSYGISSTGGKKKGDVADVALTSRIIESKLIADLEYAKSRFDPDTSDEFSRMNDKAWRFGLSGFIDKYSYEAKYEYAGRDFEGLGIQGAPKDKEGISLRGGANFTDHFLNLTFMRYNDNVRNNRILPRTVNYQSMLDYNLSYFKSLPMGITLQRSITDSTREPAGYEPTKTVVDTVSGRVSYMQPKWSFGPSVSYTFSDDKSSRNWDNRSIMYSFFLSVIPDKRISVSAAPSFIQYKDKTTGVRNDTYTANLDLRSEVIKKTVFFDVGGAYSEMKASNDSQNSWNEMINTRLAYSLKKYFPEYFGPAIALKCAYQRTKDKLTEIGNEKYTIFLVFELLSNLRI